MGDNTSIEWADATWNPLIGCDRISEGCDHCYAIGVVHRAMSPQHVGLTIKPHGLRVDWTGELRPVPHLLDQPTRWRRPRRIFVNSLSDLFHPAALDLAHPTSGLQFVAEVVAEMVANPRHTFQVLTKRPKLMSAVLGNPRFRLQLNAALARRGHPGIPFATPADVTGPWPPHIWWGTSIELDKYTFRARWLNTIDGTRWISAEPLLGPLPSLDLTGIHSLVAGGESGPGARPVHPDWVRDLRDRCTHADNPVAFLFKQWGNWLPGGQVGTGMGTVLAHAASKLTVDGRIFAAGERLGLDHMMRPVAVVNVGKHTAGRNLDGRTWDDYPAPAPAAVS